jgi:hypothetical protein
MAFKKFTKMGRGGRPIVSIWSGGQIAFNQGAIDTYNLDKFEYVILYIDEEENKIGFGFTSEENAEGATSFKKRKTGASIGARYFLDCCQIARDETKKFALKYDKDMDLYFIELGDPIKRKTE